MRTSTDRRMRSSEMNLRPPNARLRRPWESQYRSSCTLRESRSFEARRNGNSRLWRWCGKLGTAARSRSRTRWRRTPTPLTLLTGFEYRAAWTFASSRRTWAARCPRPSAASREAALVVDGRVRRDDFDPGAAAVERHLLTGAVEEASAAGFAVLSPRPHLRHSVLEDD